MCSDSFSRYVGTGSSVHDLVGDDMMMRWTSSSVQNRDMGTQWILDLCNGIVKEGSIPEDWKSSVVLPIYKGKGDPMVCGSYRGIKLLEHAMKVVERIFEHRIRQQIDDMQFDS